MSNIEQIAQKFKPCGKIKMSFGEKLCRHTSFKIGGDAALFVEAEDVDSLCLVMDEIWREEIPYFVLGGGTNVVFADEGFSGIVVSMKKINLISILENFKEEFCEEKFDGKIREKNFEKKIGSETEDDASFRGFREAKMRGARASENSVANPHGLRQNCGENEIALEKPQDLRQKIIVCEAGAGTNALVNFACERGIVGLEEFAGLPGTAGGAVYMNARCFEKEISDVARKISWIEWDGEKTVRREKIFSKEDWGYKKSPFTGTRKIVTQVEFALPQNQQKSALENSAEESENSGSNPRDLLQESAREFVALRKQKGHFEFPCAGSVFKNNRAFGEPSGKIIESLGLKGAQIGGAQIAPFHANIIINKGGATCSDVRALVELVKREAKNQRGFDLEEEIIFA